MKALNYVFYCRRCRKIVKVYEAYVEGGVFPELKPEFDVATWCCSICGEPIVQVSKKHKPGV